MAGKGCKKCHFNKLSILKLKTQEEFENDVFNINKNIKVVGKYEGRQKKIKCKCLIHEEEFTITAGHLLTGETSCAECIKIKNHNSGLKTNEQFVNELSNITKNIEVIGKYDGAKSRIEVKCKKCGHIWKPIASSLLCGVGCPTCKRSKGEERIMFYLINNNIDFQTQKKFDNLRNKLPLSYDFYLPDYNTLIEYQGQFHDGSACMVDKSKYFEKQKKNDSIKRKYARDNRYNLLEIWYYDYDRVEKILDEFLYNLENPVTTTA